MQALAKQGVFTRVFHQCQFGAVSPKPTRILTSLNGLSKVGYQQWPKLDQQGRYLGPLPQDCSCGRSHQRLIKRGADDTFATTQAAAYPEAMDFAIAQAVWQHAEEYATSLSSPAGGVSQEREVTEAEEESTAKRRGKKEESEEGIAEKRRRKEEGSIQSCEIGQEEIAALLEDAQQKAEKEIKEKEVGEKDGPCSNNPPGQSAAGKGLKRAPLKVHYKGRIRDLCDGLGKCSPGVRPAGLRGRVAGEAAKRAREAFWWEVEDLVGSMEKKERLQLMARLALGKFERSPFIKDITLRRSRIDAVLRNLGYSPDRREGDRKTAINFRRVQAFAKVTKDEDITFLEGLASAGVPLGVRGEIPHVPEVYDKKEKGEREESTPQWGGEVGEEPRSNYGSAIAHLEKVKRIVKEEEEKGWIKKVSLQEARRIYGSDVQVASLGAVPKDPHWEEIRVVHDGTHGIAVNTEIKQPNRMTFPQCDDVEVAAEALRRTGAKEKMLFAFDIKAAHRLIPVQKEDWALQSFRLEEKEELYVNRVGTFGVASAAFWWGRAAAVIFRVFHRVMPEHLLFYLMLFADDGLLMAAGEDYHKVVVALFLYLDIMEVPLSWKKTRGGFRVDGSAIPLVWRIGP